MRPTIDAREYKLLLDARRFGGALSEREANAFLRERLAEVVLRSTGARHAHDFERKARRRVRFLDTGDRLLTGARYALRLREADGTAEATLKLRTPDLFLVAATRLRGAGDDADGKLEEDVAPLEAVDRTTGTLALANPPSMRSRFARSTTQACPRAPERLGDALALYRDLRDSLMAGEVRVDAAARLRPGPTIEETVFDGPRVRLDEDVETELDLTWWAFPEGSPVPRVAELSYKVPTRDGALTRDAARRASRMFVALQAGLPRDWLDLAHPSKTELALPALREPAPA